MSTLGVYQYTGGIMSTPRGGGGGVFSTLGEYHEYNKGYHDECGGISRVHRGMFSTLGFLYKFNCFPNDLPHIYHDIPPVYS